jgi:hypothetical protein
VLLASGGSWAELDEQYLLRAFVVHRQEEDADTPIVVELLDRGLHKASNRWQAMAYDESSGSATALGHGATVEQALGTLDWHLLD